MLQRTIARVVTTPVPEPGFMGTGHTAVPVVEPGDFERTDPFILLMDDRVERPGLPLGEAHPHAGFETVTFMIDGYVRDRDEGPLNAGDLLWMTAGRGVIHNEEVTSDGKARLLQLWLTLPKSERWVEPSFQRVPLASVPVRRETGVEVRLYSGRSGKERSSTRNRVAVTLADMRLEAGATLTQELPASYNGFLYVIEGAAQIGSEAQGAGGVRLVSGQVGWLDRPGGGSPSAGRDHASGSDVDRALESTLAIRAELVGARVLLYAGEPTHDPVLVQGPFVGDTQEDNTRSFQRYLRGAFVRMSQLVRT